MFTRQSNNWIIKKKLVKAFVNFKYASSKNFRYDQNSEKMTFNNEFFIGCIFSQFSDFSPGMIRFIPKINWIIRRKTRLKKLKFYNSSL